MLLVVRMIADVITDRFLWSPIILAMPKLTAGEQEQYAQGAKVHGKLLVTFVDTHLLIPLSMLGQDSKLPNQNSCRTTLI